MSKFMFFIPFIFLVSLNLNGQQSSGSVVTMTAAEYQSLMETILKAKRKRVLAYRYRQTQVSSNASKNTPDVNKQIEALESNLKALEEDNIQQLEMLLTKEN